MTNAYLFFCTLLLSISALSQAEEASHTEPEILRLTDPAIYVSEATNQVFDEWQQSDKNKHTLDDATLYEVITLPAARDQGSSGTCYAQALATLLGSYCSSNPDYCPAQYTTISALSVVQAAHGELNLMRGASPTTTAQRIADKPELLLPEQCAPFSQLSPVKQTLERNGGTTTVPLEELAAVNTQRGMMTLKEFYQQAKTYNPWTAWLGIGPDLTKMSRDLNRQLPNLVADPEQIIQAFESARDHNFNQFNTDILLPETRSNCPDAETLIPSFSVHSLEGDGEIWGKDYCCLRPHLSRLTGAGIPTLINLCLNTADDNCQPHTIIIHGHRLWMGKDSAAKNNAELQQAQFLIQNSWGEEWQKKTNSGWITVGNLKKAMASYSQLAKELNRPQPSLTFLAPNLDIVIEDNRKLLEQKGAFDAVDDLKRTMDMLAIDQELKQEFLDNKSAVALALAYLQELSEKAHEQYSALKEAEPINLETQNYFELSDIHRKLYTITRPFYASHWDLPSTADLDYFSAVFSTTWGETPHVTYNLLSYISQNHSHARYLDEAKDHLSQPWAQKSLAKWLEYFVDDKPLNKRHKNPNTLDIGEDFEPVLIRDHMWLSCTYDNVCPATWVVTQPYNPLPESFRAHPTQAPQEHHHLMAEWLNTKLGRSQYRALTPEEYAKANTWMQNKRESSADINYVFVIKTAI